MPLSLPEAHETKGPAALLPWLGGLAVAVFVSSIMYTLKPVWVFLAIAAVVILIPAFVVRDARLYWLGWFVFCLQFDLKKNLMDGVKIVDRLQIDYNQYIFVPEIRLSDLPLLVLLLFWGMQFYVGRTRATKSRENRFVYAFLAIGCLSLAGANSVFLGVLELARQIKFFVIYVYMASVNRSKRAIRVIILVAIATLLVQSLVTAARYKLKYFEPIDSLFGGRTFMTAEKRAERLSVYDEGQGSSTARRSLGTLPSPGSTTKYLLLILPFTVLFAVRRSVFGMRWLFFGLMLVAALAFVLTFSRTSFVGLLVELGIAYWFCVRRGYVPPKMTVALLYGVVAAGVIASPKLVDFMKSRESAVDVRLHQYSTTWQIIRDHPLLGVGLNNSTGVKRQYERASRWGIDPTAQSGDEPIHSYYLTLIAEVGFVGFACYMAFWVLVVRRLLRLSRARPDTELGMYATALAIAIMGLGVGVLTDPFYEDGIESLLWTYAGLALVLERLAASEAPVPA